MRRAAVSCVLQVAACMYVLARSVCPPCALLLHCPSQDCTPCWQGWQREPRVFLSCMFKALWLVHVHALWLVHVHALQWVCVACWWWRGLCCVCERAHISSTSCLRRGLLCLGAWCTCRMVVLYVCMLGLGMWFATCAQLHSSNRILSNACMAGCGSAATAV